MSVLLHKTALVNFSMATTAQGLIDQTFAVCKKGYNFLSYCKLHENINQVKIVGETER